MKTFDLAESFRLQLPLPAPIPLLKPPLKLFFFLNRLKSYRRIPYDFNNIIKMLPSNMYLLALDAQGQRSDYIC